MGQGTSACIYGSAMTDDWVEGRSDLDLFVVLPEDKVELFGEKINLWKSNAANPLLDGFILYQTNSGLMVREFHKFENAHRFTEKFITLIDLWNIKNQSKHLFGHDVASFVRNIDIDELRRWSFKYIEEFWLPLLRDLNSRGDPSIQIPLSSLIWMASGIARILMLTNGVVCNSKREALRWLGSEYPEVRNTMTELIKDFDKSDLDAFQLPGKQAMALGDLYLHILRDAKS